MSIPGSTDGRQPGSALVNVGGIFYGTTPSGGASYSGQSYTGDPSGRGTVFAINPATGAETVVFNFTGGNDGNRPMAALIAIGGMLYGTTVYGGQAGCGTVFSFNPATGAQKVLHCFGGGTGRGTVFEVVP